MWLTERRAALPLALLLGSCESNILSQEVSPGGDPFKPIPGSCVNLTCRIPDCSRSPTTTTISGVVTIPAGTLPLYNATVYIPNAPVGPLAQGASCQRCDMENSGSPIVTTHTDVDGRFVLRDVPAGADIPVVVTLGKWRRQLTIPAVAACTDNPVSAEATRLPRRQSEGDIPRIALTTGWADAAECLLRKIGLDASEFTPEAGPGRVNLFAGNGGTNSYDVSMNRGAPFTVATDSEGQSDGWWSSLDNLKRYDLLVLSCEGKEHLEQKSAAARAALFEYANRGGRIFASHWHNIWLSAGPAPLNRVASFFPFSDAAEYEQIDATIDTALPKGGALATWLLNNGASPRLGVLPIRQARGSVLSISDSLVQRYVYYDEPNRMTRNAQYFTFNTPIGAGAQEQCGRVVFTDMHVSGNDPVNYTSTYDLSAPRLPFPTGCVTKDLSPQEKALLFLLFDLTSCVETIIG